MFISRLMKMDFRLVFRPLVIFLSNQEHNLRFYGLDPSLILRSCFLYEPNVYRSLCQVVSPRIAMIAVFTACCETITQTFSEPSVRSNHWC